MWRLRTLLLLLLLLRLRLRLCLLRFGLALPLVLTAARLVVALGVVAFTLVAAAPILLRALLRLLFLRPLHLRLRLWRKLDLRSRCLLLRALLEVAVAAPVIAVVVALLLLLLWLLRPLLDLRLLRRWPSRLLNLPTVVVVPTVTISITLATAWATPLHIGIRPTIRHGLRTIRLRIADRTADAEIARRLDRLHIAGVVEPARIGVGVPISRDESFARRERHPATAGRRRATATDAARHTKAD